MGDETRLALIVALVVAINKLSAYIWREHKESMKAIIANLTEENARLRSENAALEARKDEYKKLAHDRGNRIMRAEEHLFALALELGREPPDLDAPYEPPRKEA
jgi:regulator of replication initiation timing